MDITGACWGVEGAEAILMLCSLRARAKSPTAAVRAMGPPDPSDVSATLQETSLNVCTLGLERFGVAAGSAWQNRVASEEPVPP